MLNDAYGLKCKLMARKPLNQSGLIPLLVTVLILVGAIIYVAYTHVLHAQK